MSEFQVPFTIDLTGKTAVVTGAGGVLCSQFCKALAVCGARVALIGRRIEPLQLLAAEIAALGGTARGYSADVLQKSQLEAARDQIEDDFGLCDILINGAGGNNAKATTTQEYYQPELLKCGELSFFDLEQADISSVFDLNLMGAILTTQVFARAMANRSGAVIINVSSMSAFSPLTKIPAYSVAKAAVSNLTEWMAVHFSRVGIRVNAIAPGFFVGEQNRRLLFTESGELTPRSEKILAKTPMGRFGESRELLGALLYLVSPEAAGFVTGVIIPVDGGFNAYSGV
jgi:NAD(P)-dependent dehydrogenase (short-subunit alcohol dehydrogenase family)